MCKLSDQVDSTEQQSVDKTMEAENAEDQVKEENAEEPQETAAKEEPLEHFPWWRGGGIKAKTGRDFGVFEESLEDRANCLSLWTLSFLNPLLSLGSRKVLDARDVGIPSKQDRAERAYSEVKTAWDQQVELCEARNIKLREVHQAELDKCETDEQRAKVKTPVWKEPSISASLMTSFGKCRLIMAMLYYMISGLLSFIPVLILNDLVSYFEHVHTGQQGEYQGFIPAWAEVVLLGVIPLCVSSLQTRHQAVFAHCGVFVRTAVSTLLYRKALKVSAAGRAKTSTGQVVNMMSNDTMQLQRFLQFVGMTMVAPIQIIVALYFIFQQVRIVRMSLLIGFALYFLHRSLTHKPSPYYTIGW